MSANGSMWVLYNFLIDSSIDFELDKTQGSTTADDMSPQFITEFQVNWILCLSRNGTWIYKWNGKLYFRWKEDSGPPMVPIVFIFSPNMMLLMWVVQEWLGTRYLTFVVHFQDIYVYCASWCIDASFCPLLVKYLKVLELALFDNPVKDAVISLACPPFPTILSFPVNFPWIYFDRECCRQLVHSAMTFCGLTSIRRLSSGPTATSNLFHNCTCVL